jgi:transcriptional regulator with XRE-family HTH domain
MLRGKIVIVDKSLEHSGVVQCVTMTGIGATIRQLRNERRLTLRELAEKLAVLGWEPTYSTLGMIERGGISISADRVALVAKALGVSPEKFDEKWIARSAQAQRSDGIPVLNRVRAGIVTDYEECFPDSGEGFEYLARGNVDDEFAFALIVTGDSMQPALYDGDYVVFSPLNVPKPRVQLVPGSVVHVRIAADNKQPGCTVGRWLGPSDGNKFKVSKDNPKFKPVVLPMEHVERISVAVERRSRRI